MNNFVFAGGWEPPENLVEYFENNENLTHKINLFTNHKHYLPTTMFIHDDGVDQNPRTGCPQPESTLWEHLQSLREEENILPVMVFVHGVNYVPQEVRMIIKAIISAIIYVQMKDGSLTGPLTWENFVIYDHYLALRDLSFQRKTPNTVVGDFIYVHDFIAKEIFGPNHMETIPEDMNDLLDALMSYQDLKKELVAFHFSTMSHSERICFMKNCWDKKNIIGHPCFRDAMRDIKSMPRNNEEKEKMWWKLMDNCVFEKLILCYKKDKYDTVTSNSYRSNSGGMRCCRNVATHLGDDETLVEKDIDIMLSSIFTPMLLRFAEELHKRYALSKVITWMDTF